MSRFGYTYTPIGSFDIVHDKGFKAQSHITFYPDSASADLIQKHRLSYLVTPNGLMVCCRKNEVFNPVTKDVKIVIDGQEFNDKQVVGYNSTGNFTNWLPKPANFKLTFYGIAKQNYRTKTKWDGLALNAFIKYDAATLSGKVVNDNSISGGQKPDAIFELAFTDAGIAAETEVKLQFKTKIN